MRENNYGMGNRGQSVNLNKDLSLGALYFINYYFNKLSIGAVADYQIHQNSTFHLPKLGRVIKYFFVDTENVHLYLQDAHTFSFDKSRFDYGNNSGQGLGFPILGRDVFNINTNVFLSKTISA